MSLFELTRKLIDIPSVSGDELEVGRFIASHLERLGYRVELQEVEAERANVVATTGARPRVVLSTHMDTVPPFIPSGEDETHIGGRRSGGAEGKNYAPGFRRRNLPRRGGLGNATPLHAAPVVVSA